MAGYWSATDLAALLPRVGNQQAVTGSSPVTITQFQTIVDLRSAEFDQAAAKAGYTVPIASSASGYMVAQRVVRDGASADVLRTIYTGPDNKVADRFQAAYDAALKAVAAGDMPILGAALDASDANRVLAVWDGTASAVITATMGFPQDLGIPNDF